MEIGLAKLNLEERLEEWLERDISMLDPGLLVIDRQAGVPQLIRPIVHET